jgi:hypothetical protein
MTGLAPTRMTPAWIQRVIADNPFRELDDGNMLSAPCRIGFPHLEKPQKAMEDGKADKYAVSCLWQPGTDDLPLKLLTARVAVEKWGQAAFDQYRASPNFHNPFKDQAEKSQYEGFVPGLGFVTATGERKPSVVMQNNAPYTGRIFPGQWAFTILRPFTFETKNKAGVVVKRGLGMGLQSVMIICDDEEWGGGAVDTSTAFAGVKIDVSVNPSAAFDAPAAQPAAVSPF